MLTLDQIISLVAAKGYTDKQVQNTYQKMYMPGKYVSYPHFK